MFRVLSVLVALPMLMPQGVCLRKFDCVRWLYQTPASAPATSHARAERANEPHRSGCRCGCQNRAVRDREAAADGREPGAHDRTPPPPQEPCCPAVCKSKLDKFVQVENPQPCEPVVFVGFASAAATSACTPPAQRIAATAHAPPLYISFCTFLI